MPHKTLTIVGQGSSPTQVVADGGGAGRVFQVTSSVTVIFKNMAIEHGKATNGGNVGGTAALGGGVLIDGGQVTMSSASVASNSAVGATGAAGKPAKSVGQKGGTGGNGASADGGGIYLATGTLNIVNSSISNNKALGGKGGKGGIGGGAGGPGSNGSAGANGADGSNGVNGTSGARRRRKQRQLGPQRRRRRVPRRRRWGWGHFQQSGHADDGNDLRRDLALRLGLQGRQRQQGRRRR